MKAVVTGGAGFIGSNVVDALLERGDEVTVVDNITTGRRENVNPSAELIEADIRDGEAMADLLARVTPEAVFHLAAQIDVRKSAADPAFDASVNVIGTINMVEAARRADVSRFVNASTGGAIYGEGKIRPAPENHPQSPESPYGQSKAAAEGYLDLYRRLHDVSTVSMRFANVYGPRQDPLGEAGVIAIFCGKADAGGTGTIFGDGEQTRDYVYVGDVVAALLAGAKSEAGGAFNVGTGVETSVLELVDALGEAAGKPLSVEHAAGRPGEVLHISLNTERARAELGWQAAVGLHEGLSETLAWMRAGQRAT